MTRAALLLAGGAGTRLWPLSSDERPKQFLTLFGGQSLLQKTWGRIARFLPPESIFVSTNDRYRDLCLEQLPALRPENILAEPARRNTAPAIALSCFEIESRLGPDTTVAILPSDHFIADEKRFLEILGRAFDFASGRDALVTIGITPTEPQTGFGYLELGEEVAPGVIALRRFVEKPSRERAEEFLRAGNYAWNAGMFIWRLDAFRRELASFAPDLAGVTRANYEGAPATSIDYALMEKTSKGAAVRGDFGWSDVGSWAAVARLAGRGSAELFTAEADDVFAHSGSGRRIVVIGASNIAVVESEEGILVTDLDKAQLLAEIVKKLG